MPYRSIARPTVRYHTGETVLWFGDDPKDGMHVEYTVTKGGWKFRAIDIEGPKGTIEFGPYDLLWPEKIFGYEALYGKGYNPDHFCNLSCNPDNCHKSAAQMFKPVPDGD